MKLTPSDWHSLASAFVDALEAEAQADSKAFYTTADGSARAQHAIAQLKKLEERLHVLVRREGQR